MSKAFHQSITDRIARHHHDRNALRGLLDGASRQCSSSANNIRLESNQFGRERGKPVHSVIISPLDKKVLAFDVAEFTQPFSDRLLAYLWRQHSAIRHLPGAGCCACAASGDSNAVAPPRSVMNSRRLIVASNGAQQATIVAEQL